MRKQSLNLTEIKIRLEGLALELLKGRFPRVDVEPYYRVAEGLVEEGVKRDKAYRREIEGDTPLETLITISMHKVQTAYMLISQELDEEKLDRLLKDYETMVGDFLQSVGLLIEF
jgi:hypothetical protein